MPCKPKSKNPTGREICAWERQKESAHGGYIIWLGYGMAKWQMSNVLPAFWGYLHAQPRPFPGYALNALPLSFVCDFHKCKHFDFGFRIFSSFFVIFLFFRFQRKRIKCCTQTHSLLNRTNPVCLCEYYLCSALEIYLHRTTNLSSASAERKKRMDG